MKFTLIFKHFEKIILAIVLIAFIFSLLWLVDVFNAVSNETSSGIIITADKVAYKSIDKNNYTSINNFNSTKTWLPSKKRNTSTDDPDYILTFTDLMFPFKIARSNAPGAKNKLIPYIYYKHGTCPISKEKISLTKKAIINTDLIDTDKDGIPDSIEKKYNMDPNNPQDIYEDIDKDTFSNIREYRYNKNGIADKSIHPPLLDRLLLIKVSNTRIPFILKKIIKHGKDKKNWDIQINAKLSKQGWTTKFLKIGDSIEINDMEYTISDIHDTVENVLDPYLGALVERDTSSIILHNSMNEKITAEKNQQIYEPNRKITLKDLYTGNNVLARIGNTITLGNKDSGIEKYKIISISNNNNSVEFEKNGKIFVVNKKNNYKPPIKSTIIIDKPLKTQKK